MMSDRTYLVICICTCIEVINGLYWWDRLHP